MSASYQQWPTSCVKEVMNCHFTASSTNLGSFYRILGHFGAILGHFRPYWARFNLEWSRMLCGYRLNIVAIRLNSRFYDFGHIFAHFCPFLSIFAYFRPISPQCITKMAHPILVKKVQNAPRPHPPPLKS